MKNDFKSDLEFSRNSESAPWWPVVYAKAFPGYLSMISTGDDMSLQRRGIDRIIALKSGKEISVDEKVRRKEYSDILLERWSDEGNKKPGWIQKPLYCDYIAYAFLSSQRCYILPFLQLKSAWIKNGRIWIEKYGEVKAVNKDYTTASVPVPIVELFRSIQDSMMVDWI